MSKIINKISSIEVEDKAETAPERIQPEVIHRRDKPLYDRDTPTNTPLTLGEDVKYEVRKASREPSYLWINLCVGLAIVLWVLTVAIVAYSTTPLSTGQPRFTALQLTALALFAFGPVMIILILGYTLRKLSLLSEQAHALSRTAQNLLSPDETAYSRSAIMAKNIKGEVDLVNTHIDKAVSRMATLKETLEDQIQAIDRVSYIAENKTEIIARQLKEERNALSAIASAYDDRMAALSANLDTHSANLAKSTQQAEQKINEARISVEGAAAKINSASEIVLKNTVAAGEKLDANQTEIARLSDELKTRASELDNVYGKHASDLSALISEMRSEQESLANSLEAGLQKMREMSLTSQVSAKHLADASASGRKTVVALADAARLTDTAVKQRFADMEEMVRFSNARAESISEKAARRVQDSLAQTRKEISRIEYDMVELQDRLKYSAQQDSTQGLVSERPVTSPDTPAPKRRGIAGLKPLPESEDETPEIQNRTEAPQAEQPKMERSVKDFQDTGSPPSSSKPDKDPVEAQKPKRLSGLRPAPDDSAQFSPPDVSITFDDTDTEDDLAIPDTAQPDTPQIEPDITAPPTDDHELILEIPNEDDLIRPDEHEDITGFDPDFLRPREPKEKKKSWWRNLFSSEDENDEVLDRLTAPSVPVDRPGPATAPMPKPDSSNESIVKSLSSLGLAPAAIVDDGCIIEAVNTRMSKGPLAMSDVITHRLEDPVRHLYDQVNLDIDLRERVTEFARRFHTSLGSIEGDREAVRTRFESDAGRAFLLCDAALNRE